MAPRRETNERFDITIHDVRAINVKQQLDGLRIQEALANGGVLRIELAATGQLVVEKSFEAGLFGTENLQLLPLAEKVAEIQRATNALLSIPGALSRDDLQTVDLLNRAITGSPVERPIQSIRVKLTRPGAQRVLEAFTRGTRFINCRDSIRATGDMVSLRRRRTAV